MPQCPANMRQTCWPAKTQQCKLFQRELHPRCLPTVGMFAACFWQTTSMFTDQSFAKRVLSAFEAAGHATDDEVRRAGGPSTTSMTRLRKVADGKLAMGTTRTNMFHGIDEAAQWEYGSARKLLEQGTQPVVRGSPTEDSEQGTKTYWSQFVHQLEDRFNKIENRLDAIERAICDKENRG